MTTFIYALIDPFTEEVRYVGKSNRPKERFRDHLYEATVYGAKRNTHKYRWILQVLNQGSKPRLRILEEVALEIWGEREQFWMDHFRAQGCRLTNSCDGGYGVTNISDETRAKLSAIRTGRKQSPEAIEKRAAKLRGIARSKEFGAKISATKKGKSNGLEGRPCSPEKAAKISAAQKGKPRFISPEHRAAMVAGVRAALTGKPRSPETIEKMRAANKGQHVSPEQRALLSESVRNSPAHIKASEEQRREAWREAGHTEIPELRCGYCGAVLYRAPSRLKKTPSAIFYCTISHQMLARQQAIRLEKGKQ